MTKTKAELTGVAERLNSVLKDSGYKVEIGHRNGYTAIDYSLLDGSKFNNIEAGLTDKGAIQYMRAMLNGIDLITNSNNK